ncbi:MAG TPA: GNAT family N-acetyltransferase, partial [Actinomycetota bacterium]|nr:GNAT family N-acetyltransferase [Actinomycetota bacterium]
VPVGTAMVHLDDGAIGIFGVATSRSARNRGIATAVTGRAMQEGRTHADLAWLLATSEGRPLYERMGFQVVSDWTVWVS